MESISTDQWAPHDRRHPRRLCHRFTWAARRCCSSTPPTRSPGPLSNGSGLAIRLFQNQQRDRIPRDSAASLLHSQTGCKMIRVRHGVRQDLTLRFQATRPHGMILARLAVDRQEHGKGLGAALLKAALRRAVRHLRSGLAAACGCHAPPRHVTIHPLFAAGKRA